MIKEGGLWSSLPEFIGLFREGFDPAKALCRVEFELVEVLL